MNDREFINAIDADGQPLNIAVRNGRISHIGPQRGKGTGRGFARAVRHRDWPSARTMSISPGCPLRQKGH